MGGECEETRWVCYEGWSPMGFNWTAVWVYVMSSHGVRSVCEEIQCGLCWMHITRGERGGIGKGHRAMSGVIWEDVHW